MKSHDHAMAFWPTSHETAIMQDEDEIVEERRARLKRVMARKGWHAAEWARQAGIASGTLYNFLKGRSRSLSQDVLEKLAKAAGMPTGDLVGPANDADLDIQGIRILGIVEAGYEMPACDLENGDLGTVNVPLPPELRNSAFGLRVKGTSMDRVFPPGSVVICIKIFDWEGDLQSGMRLVVYRRSHGEVEATLKELQYDGVGQPWLWPRSNDPNYQTPIPMPAVKREEHFDDIDEVQVHAVVIGAYTPEPCIPLF